MANSLWHRHNYWITDLRLIIERMKATKNPRHFENYRRQLREVVRDGP